MKIISRIKNLFSFKPQSMKLIEKIYNFNFLNKFYASIFFPFIAYCFFLTVLFGLSVAIIFAFPSKITLGFCFIIFLIYNVISFCSTFDKKFFLQDVFHELLFKFSTDYHLLKNIDKKRKSEVLNQQQLKEFIEKYVIQYRGGKENFALFLSKNKYKAVSKYDLNNYLLKRNELKNNDLYKEALSYFEKLKKDIPNKTIKTPKKIKENKQEKEIKKGIEIIDYLLSDLPFEIDENNNIILDKAKNKLLKEQIK